jgi:hypothetical protein
MVPGSEVGFTTSHSANHPSHHHHHSGNGAGAGAGSSGHGGAPNIAHAYTVLTGMDAGATPSPHFDDRRFVGACGTDAAYTTDSNVDAAGNQKSHTGPESDPPRVRSTYKSFGGSGNGSGNGMTDDAVDLASDDDDDEEDLSPAERLQQRKLRAARNIASQASQPTDSEADAMSIESSKQSSFTSGDFETTATRTTLEAGARSAATAVVALTSAVYNADGSTAELAAVPAPPEATRLQDVPAACLDRVFSFMPLDDVAAMRRSACAALVEAADRVAPRPMPGMTFVRWQPQALRTASLADTIAPARTRTRGGKRGGANKAPPTVAATVPFEWRCLACSALTNGNKTCTVCGSDSSMTACRIFVGQLRKQRTAELLSHLIGVVCPSARVLHIESHTNGHTGRSKGCAWVYLDSTKSAVNLTAALHKRAFVDVDANGGEGVWYTDGAALEDSLVAFAAERVATATAEISPTVEKDAAAPASSTNDCSEFVDPGMRCPQLMPRQPVVAELPGTSLLAELALDAFAA